MHFDGIKVIAPLVGVISRDAVARDGSRHAEHGIALRVQINDYRRSRAPVGPGVS